MQLTRHKFRRLAIGDNVVFTAFYVKAYSNDGLRKHKSVQKFYLAKQETGKVVGIKRMHTGQINEIGYDLKRQREDALLLVDKTLYFWEVKRSLLGRPVLVADEDLIESKQRNR